MSWPANEDDVRRRIFLLDIDGGTEAVLRALGAFPAQGGEISRLTLEPHGGGGARLEIEAEGLDGDRAERLQRRLAQVTAVQAVAAGWR